MHEMLQTYRWQLLAASKTDASYGVTSPCDAEDAATFCNGQFPTLPFLYVS